MKLKIIFIPLLLNFTSLSYAEEISPIPAPKAVGEKVCEGQIDYFKRACNKKNPDIKDPNYLKKGEFGGCSDIIKATVTYENVGSKTLGPHKLCSIIEQREFSLNLSKSKQTRTELYYDFGPMAVKEVRLESPDEKVFRFFDNKKIVECKIPNSQPNDLSKRECFSTNSNFAQKEIRNKLEPLSDEDLIELRKGRPFTEVTHFLGHKKSNEFSTDLKKKPEVIH